jgi:hypothetical protein
LPSTCKYVRTVVSYKGKTVEEKDIAICDSKPGDQLKIDDNKPLEFEFNSQKKCYDTESSYSTFEKLKIFEGTYIRHFTVIISEKVNSCNYIEISTASVPFDAGNLQATVDLIRETAFKDKDVNIEFDYKTLLFISGKQFKNWIEINKYDISDLQKEGKIKQ